MLKIKYLVLLLLIFSVFLVGSFLKQPKKSTNFPNYVAAVLPHHLLAESFIDDFISRLNYVPKKIYVIGPNHSEIGQSKIITNNNSESAELINTGLVRIDNEIVSQEHSVQVFQDKFKNKFPNTPVIPMIISTRMTMDDIDKISQFLSSHSTDNTLIICSIDFSHYLLLPDAQSHDQDTINLIINKNYSKIFSLTNDNIDSSKSLLILLKTLDLTGHNHMVNLNHSNSALILQDLTIPSTTSYFELAFY